MSVPDSPEQPEPFAGQTPGQTHGRSLRARLRLPRTRRGRWLALGAAVVVLAGVAGGAAVAVHHHERDGVEWAGQMDGPGFGPGRGFGPGGEAPRHLGKHGGKPGDVPGSRGNVDGAAEEGTDVEAPAPLPALPADQAVVKAQGAVPGGKVDQLRVVGQQGGGTAWQLDVLGPDGVRHLVTVDGTGTITGNTVR